MANAKNERIALALQLLREVRSSLEAGTAFERLKVIEKELLRLDEEIEQQRERPPQD